MTNLKYIYINCIAVLQLLETGSLHLLWYFPARGVEFKKQPELGSNYGLMRQLAVNHFLLPVAGAPML